MKKIKLFEVLAVSALLVGVTLTSCSQAEDDITYLDMLAARGAAPAAVTKAEYKLSGIKTDGSNGYCNMLGNNFIHTTKLDSGAVIYSSDTKLQLVTNEDSTGKNLLFFADNGFKSNKNVGTSVNLAEANDYVAIPVPAAGTVKVTVGGSSKKAEELGKVVVFDQAGKVKLAQTVSYYMIDTDPDPEKEKWEDNYLVYTATFTEATTAIITYSREKQKAGGLYINKVVYTPSN